MNADNATGIVTSLSSIQLGCFRLISIVLKKPMIPFLKQVDLLHFYYYFYYYSRIFIQDNTSVFTLFSK